MKKSIKFVALGSTLAVLGFGLALHKNIIKLPISGEIHPQYIADFGNDKILMGASHNVFVGKVIMHKFVKNVLYSHNLHSPILISFFLQAFL